MIVFLVRKVIIEYSSRNPIFYFKFRNFTNLLPSHCAHGTTSLIVKNFKKAQHQSYHSFTFILQSNRLLMKFIYSRCLFQNSIFDTVCFQLTLQTYLISQNLLHQNGVRMCIPYVAFQTPDLTLRNQILLSITLRHENLYMGNVYKSYQNNKSALVL